jgi:3-(methylthio)propionyl---CoA ligase
VVFVDEIPHTATGKVSKLRLREQFRDFSFGTPPDTPAIHQSRHPSDLP